MKANNGMTAFGMTKTDINTRSLDVPTNLLPGNFGCRVVDGMMPSDLSVVFRTRRTTLVSKFVCDNNTWTVPEMLQKPVQTDYLTDEESDDGAGFELKIPDLGDLITEFELGDDTLIASESDFKNHLSDLQNRGMLKEVREEIHLEKEVQSKLLNENMTMQRGLLNSRLPGMLGEINNTIRQPNSKIYLR